MKIIENNNSVKMTCKKCESKLQIHRNDINYHYCLGHASYFYFTCCACDERVQVNLGDMPYHWCSFLLEKQNKEMGEDGEL